MKSIIERYSKQKEECQPLLNPASEVKVCTQQTLIFALRDLQHALRHIHSSDCIFTRGELSMALGPL